MEVNKCPKCGCIREVTFSKCPSCGILISRLYNIERDLSYLNSKKKDTEKKKNYSIKRINPIWVTILILCIIAFYIYLNSELQNISLTAPYNLSYISKVFGNAKDSDKLPMIIVFHGAGADENDLVPLLEKLKINVRLVSFRAPFKYGTGFNWVKGKGKTEKEYNDNKDTVLEQVAYSLKIYTDYLTYRYSTVGKPFILGFSAGAKIVYYLLVNYPQSFQGGFAVSGYLNSKFFPSGDNYETINYPGIYAYHGIEDKIIPVSYARGTVNRIRAEYGWHVEYMELSVGHVFTNKFVKHIRETMVKHINLF